MSAEPPTKRRKLNPIDDEDSQDIDLDTWTPKIQPTSQIIEATKCNACKSKLNPCASFIKCAECKSTNICHQCFKKGIEFNHHKRFHRYHVIPSINIYPHPHNNKQDKIDSIWTIKDIWNLHEGIRKFGIGNWSLIAKFIDNPKINRYKCEQYVMQHYAKSDNNVSNTSNKKALSIPSDTASLSPTRSRKRRRSTSCSGFDGNKLNKKDMENHARLLKCGYNPKRNEFEVKWNDNAERIVSEMFMSPYDIKNEREMKLEGIRLYHESVKDRERRKKKITSSNYGVMHGLNEKWMKREENKEIFDNMAMFAHYAENKQQFRNLVDGLIEEKNLRERVLKIRRYLLNGVTSLEDMKDIERYYEMNKNKKEMLKLDKVVEHLRLKRLNGVSRNRNNRRRYKQDNDDGMIMDERGNDFDVNEVGYQRLTECEKKLCRILKINADQYEKVKDSVGHLVKKYGLIVNGQIHTQIHIDIDDDINLSMGVVNPQNESI